MAKQATVTIGKARRMIAAIDRRIKAVRRELMRDRKPFDKQSAHEWQRAWDSRPGLQGIECALFARRGDWQEILNEAETKEAQIAAMRERRRHKNTTLHQCEHCGSYYREAA